MGKKAILCCSEEEKKLFEQCVAYIKENNIEKFKECVQKNPAILSMSHKLENDYSWEAATLLHHVVARAKRQLFVEFILNENSDSFDCLGEKRSYGEMTPYEFLLQQINNRWNEGWIAYFQTIFAILPGTVDYFWENQSLTLLRIAIEKQYEPFALELLEKFKDHIDLKRTFGSEQKTYLHLAAENGLTGLADKLVAFGVDVDAQTFSGKWPDKTALYIAVGKGDQASVEMLLSRGADPNIASNNYGETALHLALQNDYESIALKLIAGGADVTARNGCNFYNYAAHIAAREGLFQVLREIYSKSPNLLEVADHNGHKPLVLAIEYDQYEIVVMLYGYRVNFSLTVSHDFSSSRYTSDIRAIKLIEFALLNGAEKVLPFLLKIASHKQIELVEFALKHAHKDKKTAVIKALLGANNYPEKLSDFEICSKLLESDDCEDLALEYVDERYANEKTDDGDTLLHLAAKYARFKVIHGLLSFESIEIKFNAENYLPSMLLAEIPKANSNETEEKNRKIVENLVKKEISAIAIKEKIELQDRWVATLDVEYKSNKPEKTIIVPGDEIHRALSANQTYIDECYDMPMVKNDNGCYKRKNPNCLTAVLTFIVSDKPYKKGDVTLKRLTVTIPIEIDGSRTNTFTSVLDIDLMRSVQLDCLAQGSATVESTILLYEQLQGDRRENKFWLEYQHSERLLMFHLNKKETVVRIADQLLAQGFAKDHKLYGMILDEHSTNYSCGRCLEGHHGFHHHPKLKFPYGSVYQLMSVLRDKGVDVIEPKAGIRMLTRISSRRPYGSPQKTVQEHAAQTFNMNTVTNETILCRDNEQCCPDVYQDSPSSNAFSKFLLSQNAQLTFFVSGDPAPTLKPDKKRPANTILESSSKRQKTGETDNDVVMQESGQPESSVPKLINK